VQLISKASLGKNLDMRYDIKDMIFIKN